jgi:hypothetical protein
MALLPHRRSQQSQAKLEIAASMMWRNVRSGYD